MKKHDNIVRAENRTETYRPRFKSAYLWPKYWPIWLGFLFLWVLMWMPWWVRSAISYPLGWLAYWQSKKRRNIADINLKRCFPTMDVKQRVRISKQHFYYKIRTALDLGLLCWASESRLRRLITIEGEAHIKNPIENNQAVIWLTCHALPLEFGATRISLDYSGVGLVKAAKNPLVDWILQRTRTRFNAVLYTRDQGLRPIVKAVKDGIMFYYLPDEDLGGPASVFAPFFAESASTLSILGRLSTIAKAEVVPSITFYKPGTGKYILRFYPVLEDFPMASREQDALRMNQELEKLISVQLPQYMWGMKIFKNRAEGQADLY